MFAYLSGVIVFCYSHGPCFLCTCLLSTIYSYVLGKHRDRQNVCTITIYRTYRVTNCVTLVLGSLLSDKMPSVNSCIFHSSFIAQGKEWLKMLQAELDSLQPARPLFAKPYQAQRRVALDQSKTLVGFMQGCGIFHWLRQVDNPAEAYFGRGPWKYHCDVLSNIQPKVNVITRKNPLLFMDCPVF